jgi:hypothetical protein
MARETFEQRVPESLGPGTEVASGGVTYGGTDRPTVAISPARPAWERDADMAAARDRARCDRCGEIPDALVLALRQALADAKAARPPL